MKESFSDKWLLFDFDYHWTVLNHILNLIETEGYPLDKINKRKVLDVLSKARLDSSSVLDQCFDYFFAELEETNDDGNSLRFSFSLIIHRCPYILGEPLYAVKGEDVSRLTAETLLKATKKFNKDDFLVMWRDIVPHGEYLY